MTISELIREARNRDLRPAFSYDRVSTQEQADTGSSLQYQSEHAKRYAEQNGLLIVRYFSAAESAFSEGRAVFNEMLTLAEKYGIRDLIFKNADRLSRNDIDHARIKKLARKGGYRIHYYELSTVLDGKSTAEAEMFLDNTAVMARYWSNKISQSVRAANRYKIQKGIPPGRPPHGYLFDHEKKTFKIDESLSRVLYRIFDSYDIDKKSLQAICDELNRAGIFSPKGRSWRKAHLAYILTNPIYAGFFYDHDGNEHAANFPSYITRDRYDERRQKMRAQSNGTNKRNTEYLFSGLLRYEGTGRLLTGEVHKGFVYYAHRRPNVSFREDQIISSVVGAAMQFQAWDRERRAIFDTSVSEEIQKIVDEVIADKRPLKKSLEQKIGNLKAEEMRLLRLYSKDLISQDMLFNSIEGVKAERNECEEKLSKVDIYDTGRADEFKKNVYLFFANDFRSLGKLREIRNIVDHIIIPEAVRDIDKARGTWAHNIDPHDHKPVSPAQLVAEMYLPITAKIVFKRPYRSLFDHIEKVRNCQGMLPR